MKPFFAIAAAAVAAAAAVGAGDARAAPLEYGGDKYQRELVDLARAGRGLVADPDPDGKIVEAIVTVPYKVFLQQDPYPDFLNWVHVTTAPDVVAREMLFKVGDPWSAEAVRESAHNLRTYLFLSAAQIVACKGSKPDRVLALVVTKDLWSLRLNTAFLYSDAQLEELTFEVAEENVLGRMKRFAVDLGLTLFVEYAGLSYKDPRILGSQTRWSGRADLIWNRASGALEGEFAELSLGKPLYTLDTRWSWGTSFSYRNDIYRLMSAGAQAQYVSPTTSQAIPYRMDRHLMDFQAGVTRSYGHMTKTDFSAGYRAFVHRFGVPASEGAAPLPATQADFEANVLPLSEGAGMLYVGFKTYEGPFRQLIDIQSFAVTEEFRLGTNLSAELRYASPALGFSSAFLQPDVDLSWSSFSGDDLFIANGSVDVRYQPQLSGESPWANGSVTLSARNVSPRFASMRLHSSLQAGRRFNDYNHSFNVLGGDSLLRGYPTNYFLGSNFWAGNLELRTMPVAFFNVYAGFASFIDVGSAANQLSELVPHASVGAGVRIGLPQFNQQVIRIDLGLPLEAVPGGASYLVAQFGQAF